MIIDPRADPGAVHLSQGAGKLQDFADESPLLSVEFINFRLFSFVMNLYDKSKVESLVQMTLQVKYIHGTIL